MLNKFQTGLFPFQSTSFLPLGVITSIWYFICSVSMYVSPIQSFLKIQMILIFFYNLFLLYRIVDVYYNKQMRNFPWVKYIPQVIRQYKLFYHGIYNSEVILTIYRYSNSLWCFFYSKKDNSYLPIKHILFEHNGVQHIMCCVFPSYVGSFSGLSICEYPLWHSLTFI